jgi:hypothetical protein
MKRKILGSSEIIIALIMLAILLFNKISDNAYYFIMITVFIGWAIPYFITIISGVAVLKDSHHKLNIVSNILNTILLGVLLFFIIKLYDKGFIIFLIEYIIMIIISIINIVYLIIYFKNHPDKEIEKIKKEKKKNNGAVV